MILRAEVDENSLKMSVLGDIDQLKFATAAIINGVAESIAKQDEEESKEYLEWVSDGLAEAVDSVNESRLDADNVSELIDKLTENAAKDILKAIGDMLK